MIGQLSVSAAINLGTKLHVLQRRRGTVDPKGIFRLCKDKFLTLPGIKALSPACNLANTFMQLFCLLASPNKENN
jgi:hypothetical protein